MKRATVSRSAKRKSKTRKAAGGGNLMITLRQPLTLQAIKVPKAVRDL
jgi:hypothetical protein